MKKLFSLRHSLAVLLLLQLTFVSCAQQEAPNFQNYSTSAVSGIQLKNFVEPSEQAFVARVPANWQSSGVITRPVPTTANTCLLTQSPDHSEIVFSGNVNRVLFQVPNEMTQMMGLSEGASVGGGMILSYKSPSEYLIWHLSNDQNNRIENIQILSSQVAPQKQQIAQMNNQRIFGSFMQIATEVNRVDLTCTINGKPYKGKVYVEIIKSYSGTPSWMVNNLEGVFVRPDKNLELPLYDQVLASVQLNPNWVQGVNQQSHQYNTSNYSSRRPNIMQYYTDARTGAFDPSTDYSDEWSKALLDQEDVMNSSGEVFRVDHTYDHYYQDQQGNIYNSQHSIDNNPNLQKMNIIRNY